MPTHANTSETDAALQVPVIGDLIAGKYRVTSVVGTGGMGVVLAATHVELGQSVAIKVLTLPEDDARRDEARERFLREGRATAALVSDHVVRVHDVGMLDTGAPFMVMELLRGHDLSVVLSQSGPLPLQHAADYVRQAADAIACAHAHGIVHRDLKPSNLFLTQRSDGTALIKVLDFGISKTTQHEVDRVAANLTAARSVLGTPFYMSPEQIRDAKEVDFRADIWSLGLILHELLSGSPAFEGTTLPGVCAAIAADPPAALRLKRPEVSVELEAIVLKCLEKDPNKRFQDVRDLSMRLAPHCGRPDTSLLAPLSDKTIRSSALTFDIAERQNGPTLSQPNSDTGTLASAHLTRSGQRSLPAEPAVVALNQNTLSAEPTTHPAPPAGAPPLRARTRALGWGAAGTLLLLAVSALTLHHAMTGQPVPAASPALPRAPKPSATAPITAPPPTRQSFALEISASPASVDVFEGRRLLGPTPLRVSIDGPSVDNGPRTFTLRKPGYLPYTIRQGNSTQDISVLAKLTPEPTQPKAVEDLPKRPPIAPKPLVKPTPPGSPSDIFMRR